MPSAADKGKKKAAADESGDEYDSGGEVERTAADDSFIDNEDDDDDLLKEYAQDKQNFDDDERPEGHEKQKKKKVRASVCVCPHVRAPARDDGSRSPPRFERPQRSTHRRPRAQGSGEEEDDDGGDDEDDDDPYNRTIKSAVTPESPFRRLSSLPPFLICVTHKSAGWSSSSTARACPCVVRPVRGVGG